MTLDGKIATTSGHSAWVTSPAARARVFEMRARSDVVIVGGNTVRVQALACAPAHRTRAYVFAMKQRAATPPHSA